MTLSWASIFRMGLVQLCLGAIVVLTTSTLNRLMVVELSLPAVLPGLLVGLHYGIQITRPSWGYKSDTGGHRTRYIIGGMATLGLGAFLAALAVTLFESGFAVALALSVVAYGLIGAGVAASGTSLLALLATATHPRRRAAAATITWVMMICGIILTSVMVGAAIDPYSHTVLLKAVAVVCGSAVALTTLAILGIESRHVVAAESESLPLRQGLAEVWAEPRARRFTLFIFLSMTAYFMQELILEPYAGLVFGLTPGQTTTLSGMQNGGVLAGMLLVGLASTGFGLGSLRLWVIAGCTGSAVALLAIAAVGVLSLPALLQPAVIGLGLFNGMFAVAAIGSMMALAGEGRGAREGTRMGLWGASQAIAAGIGGLTGAAAADVMRALTDDAGAFGAVFSFEAALFVVAAGMAVQIIDGAEHRISTNMVPGE